VGDGEFSLKDVSQALRLIAHTIEHKEERRNGYRLEDRRLATVQRLLAGERLDASLLDYNMTASHAGFVVVGSELDTLFTKLRSRGQSRLLLVRVGPDTLWGWFGGRRRALDHDLELLSSQEWPGGTAVACGEPAKELGGWRLTHRQSIAALPIAVTEQAPVVHYRDVPLLATALRDDLLASSLRQAYLEPLETSRDGGRATKATLRAYFKTKGNISSAAPLLEVNRATVRNRLSAVEDRLGRAVDDISSELKVALKLDEFGRGQTDPDVAGC
jgi:PucR C-terminal helix-turn-helix domain